MNKTRRLARFIDGARDAGPKNSGPVFYAAVGGVVFLLLNIGALVLLTINYEHDRAADAVCHEHLVPNGDLNGCDFAGDHLTHRDLTNADLTNTHLAYANLSGTDLTEADLTGADLTRATLVSVTWHNTTCPDGTVTSRIPCGT